MSTGFAVALEKPAITLPALIESAGKPATWRFLEFFTVNIRNKNTRTAYAQAACFFLRWCGEKGITRIQDVQPVHVAAYVEELGRVRSAPTVKQHLACIRMLFDWLVTGQVMPSNPAHAVRGPRHSISKGATAVISSVEARELLESMDSSTLVGLRDRAIVATMAFTFARVSAVVGLKVEDYYTQKKRAPTVKQHLAALRMLFAWLVLGHVLNVNPPHAVRGPKHVIKEARRRC